MNIVSHRLEVNPDDDSEHVHLSRHQVWERLFRKAENAVSFVWSITYSQAH